jgi:peptidoglycan-associated lipoprotein
MYKNLMRLVAVTAAVFMFSGCQGNKNNAGLFGSDPGLFGSGDIIEGDLTMMGAGPMIPDNVNRSMFDPVLFPYDSSTVSPSEAPKVEAVAQYLRGNKANVLIEGHADERGSNEYNLSLGERRAQAVREYLLGLGVDASVVQTSSKGEEEPAVLGHTEEAWRQNRRVVFGIY